MKDMTETMPARDLDLLSRTGLSAGDLENLDDDVSGRPVYDRFGDEIGKVDDVLIDPQQLRAPFLLAGWGGILGIGHQQRLVPMEAVDRIEPEAVYLDRDKDLVTAAPPYEDTDDEDQAELQYRSIYDLYGITPYWMERADVPDSVANH